MQLFKKKPKLSVVIVFFNMRREATRTLHSLTTAYQRDIAIDDYEVIALDSSSTEALDGDWVESLQKNFKYRFVESDLPTPCRALNFGAAMARSNTLVNLIDGARILSPGILVYMLRAKQAFDTPFTYTIGMHLGRKPQNETLLEGYDQAVEDQLLESIPWQTDGYKLFDISSLASSSKEGFLYPIYESNCFAVSRTPLEEIGGFDEAFEMPGGGLVNLDVFRKLFLHESTTPVLLTGEATFHQFHGGVATNVPATENMWDKFDEEYERLRGRRFDLIGYPRKPRVLGELNTESRRFFLNDELQSGGH